MQKVAEGQEFGPITDKLIRDLLNAGVRLTAQVQDSPEQLTARLQAYTVEITTALALAVGKIELAQTEQAPPAPHRRARTGTDSTGRGHLSLVKSELKTD